MKVIEVKSYSLLINNRSFSLKLGGLSIELIIDPNKSIFKSYFYYTCNSCPQIILIFDVTVTNKPKNNAILTSMFVIEIDRHRGIDRLLLVDFLES